MKNKKFNFKLIIIVLSVVVLSVVGFFYGIRLSSDKVNKFTTDGFIIGDSKSSESSNLLYFSSGNIYEENYDESISLINTDNKKVNVNDNSFIHYNNGSVAVFKKNVILDLDNLSKNSINYYNFYEELELTKNNTAYIVSNSSKSLSFKTLLLKSSDDKYLILSNNIKLNDNNTVTSFDEFVELSFLDGNIIRIENKKDVYQSISTDLSLSVGAGITIDLSNRNVLKDKEVIVNLNELTIDSDDNIDIPVDATTTTTTQFSTVQVTSKSNLSVEGEVVEDDVPVTALLDPTFSIYDLNVTTYSADFYLNIVDTSNLLVGAVNVEIFESSTGKKTYSEEITSYFYDAFVDTNDLKPNTDYTLVVSATINKNDSLYTKNFIQKTFRTDDIGISVVKDYFTSDSLNFTVKLDKNSDISGFKLTVYNSLDEKVSENTYDIEDELNISLLDLNSNSKYKIVINNFSYNTLTVINDDKLELNYKTLKKAPSSSVEDGFGEVVYSADKKLNKYSIGYSGINDPDNGVVEYRYEIYKGESLYKSATSKSLGQVVVDLGDTGVDTGSFTARVITVFNDNEKIIEYYSDIISIKISDIQLPKVSFEENKITFNSINGNVIIDDPDNLIKNGKVTLILFDTLGNKVVKSYEVTTPSKMYLPVEYYNLSNNESYSILVYADIYRGGESVNTLLDTLHIKTLDTEIFNVEWDLQQSCNNILEFSFRLAYHGDNESNANEQLNDIKNITITLAGDQTGPMITKSFSSTDIIEAIKSYGYVFFTASDFGLNETIKYNAGNNSFYTAEIVSIRASNDIVLSLTGNASNAIYPCDNYVPTYQQLLIEVDTNETLLDTVDENFQAAYENAIIGYKVKVNLSNKNGNIRKVNYYVVDSDVSTRYIMKSIPIEGNDIPEVQFNFGDYTDKTWFHRGGTYFFAFDMELDLNVSKNFVDYTFNCQYPAYQYQLQNLNNAPNFDSNMVTYDSLSSISACKELPSQTQTSNKDKKDYELGYMIRYGNINSSLTLLEEEVKEDLKDGYYIRSDEYTSKRISPRIIIYPSEYLEGNDLNFKYKIFDKDKSVVGLTVNDNSIGALNTCDDSKNCEFSDLKVDLDSLMLENITILLNYKFSTNDKNTSKIVAFDQYTHFVKVESSTERIAALLPDLYKYEISNGNIIITMNANALGEDFTQRYISTKVNFNYQTQDGKNKSASYDLSTSSSPYYFTCTSENICKTFITLKSLVNKTIENGVPDIFDRDVTVTFETFYDNGKYSFDDLEDNKNYALEYGYNLTEITDGTNIVKSRYICNMSSCADYSALIASGSKYTITQNISSSNTSRSVTHYNILNKQTNARTLYLASGGYRDLNSTKKFLIKHLDSFDYVYPTKFTFDNSNIPLIFNVNELTTTPMSINMKYNYDSNEYTSGDSRVGFNYLKISTNISGSTRNKYLLLSTDSVNSPYYNISRSVVENVIYGSIDINIPKLLDSVDFYDKDITISVLYCENEKSSDSDMSDCLKFNIHSTDGNEEPTSELKTSIAIKYRLASDVKNNYDDNFMFKTSITGSTGEEFSKFFDLNYYFNYSSFYAVNQETYRSYFDGVDYILYYMNGETSVDVNNSVNWSEDININGKYYNAKAKFELNSLSLGSYRVCIKPYIVLSSGKNYLVEDTNMDNCINYHFSTLLEPTVNVYARKNNATSEISVFSMINDNNLTVINNKYDLTFDIGNTPFSEGDNITNRLNEFKINNIDLKKPATVTLDYVYTLTNSTYDKVEKSYLYLINPSVEGIYIGSLNMSLANRIIKLDFANSTMIQNINKIKYSLACNTYANERLDYYVETDKFKIITDATDDGKYIMQIEDENVLNCQSGNFTINFYKDVLLVDKYSSEYYR